MAQSPAPFGTYAVTPWRDQSALRALIEQAPTSVRPRQTFTEICKRSDNPLPDYLEMHGYRVWKQTTTNAILDFNDSNLAVMGSA